MGFQLPTSTGEFAGQTWLPSTVSTPSTKSGRILQVLLVVPVPKNAWPKKNIARITSSSDPEGVIQYK